MKVTGKIDRSSYAKWQDALDAAQIKIAETAAKLKKQVTVLYISVRRDAFVTKGNYNLSIEFEVDIPETDGLQNQNGLT